MIEQLINLYLSALLEKTRKPVEDYSSSRWIGCVFFTVFTIFVFVCTFSCMFNASGIWLKIYSILFDALMIIAIIYFKKHIKTFNSYDIFIYSICLKFFVLLLFMQYNMEIAQVEKDGCTLINLLTIIKINNLGGPYPIYVISKYIFVINLFIDVVCLLLSLIRFNKSKIRIQLFADESIYLNTLNTILYKYKENNKISNDEEFIKNITYFMESKSKMNSASSLYFIEKFSPSFIVTIGGGLLSYFAVGEISSEFSFTLFSVLFSILSSFCLTLTLFVPEPYQLLKNLDLLKEFPVSGEHTWNWYNFLKPENYFDLKTIFENYLSKKSQNKTIV